MKKIAVFPGSFSPFTKGHESIIESALPIFDKIIIAIGKNPKKDSKFSTSKRIKWIKKIYSNNEKILIKQYEGLTIDYCKKIGAQFILRGLRNIDDFKFEREAAQMNKKLNPEIDTVLFIAPSEVAHISSSMVREIMQNNGDVSQFVTFSKIN